MLACQDKVSLVVRRAHSSVVEHRTAVPVVTGSNPVVPFFSQMFISGDIFKELKLSQV